MYLLIVADGTLFVPTIKGEIMCEKKDSLGRGFLTADTVFSNHISSSPFAPLRRREIQSSLFFTPEFVVKINLEFEIF